MKQVTAVNIQERYAVQGDCWIWQGYIDKRGYGRCQTRGETLAHRVTYRLLCGPIPAGMTLDHLCRTPACVRPEHLEPVSLAVNILRGISGPALNAAKTHCVNGHAFTSANTYLRPNGHRDCRACIRRRVRQYKRRAA